MQSHKFDLPINTSLLNTWQTPPLIWAGLITPEKVAAKPALLALDAATEEGEVEEGEDLAATLAAAEEEDNSEVNAEANLEANSEGVTASGTASLMGSGLSSGSNSGFVMSPILSVMARSSQC